jgi:prolyl oligopeptidase
MQPELNDTHGVVETIQGISVADPYRWLEDRTSSETKMWIARQHKRFQDYVSGLGVLDALKQSVQEVVDVERVDQLGRVRGRYFYRRRRVGEQQPSIYVMKTANRRERLLVDSSFHEPYSTASILKISNDSNLLAYELKRGGEHSGTIGLVDVATGRILPDHLDHGLNYGFVFSSVNEGFYYCREFDDDSAHSDSEHLVYFHRLGSAVEDDRVLLRVPRTRTSKLVLHPGGKMLGATLSHELDGVPVVDLYAATQENDCFWTHAIKNQPAPFIPIFYRGRLFAQRFQDTRNGEIVELDVRSAEPLRVIVPEWDLMHTQCDFINDYLYVSYIAGTETIVRIWTLAGKFIGTLPLEAGNTWRLLRTYSEETSEFFLHCESFTKLPTLIGAKGKTLRRDTWHKPHLPTFATSIDVEKLAYSSSDGLDIVMSVVGLRSFASVSNRPLIMTAYGGFGLTLTPQFSAFVGILLTLGFLFALPEIRGGGERGPQWHEAARGRHRQVAFDDFISAAEWLCDNGFTSPKRLGIFGGSNSGLLVGAAITQRPELFRAAICIAPILDMVRYHLFDRAHTWAGEYGTSDEPDDFKALLAYSPYHQVRPGINYPAVLFVSGDQDTRCNPAHARKMCARLGNRSAQKNPVLLDHSAARGHSPNMPLSVRVDAITHRVAFLCHELGVSLPAEIKI